MKPKQETPDKPAFRKYAKGELPRLQFHPIGNLL